MDEDRGYDADDDQPWDDGAWDEEDERRYQERRAAERSSARRRRRQGAVFALLVLLVLGAGTTAAGVYNGWWEWPPFSGEPEPLPTRTVVACPTPEVTAAPVAEVTLAVLNSTNRAGLAGDTATALQARGFVVGAVGNDPAEVPGAALVRHGPDGLLQARTVAAQVEGAELAADTREGTAVELVLGDAFAGLRAPEDAAVLLEPAPAASPPGCVPIGEPAQPAPTEPAPTEPASSEPAPTG